MIVDRGCGDYILPHILQHLTFTEFAEFGSVCELYSIDLVPYVRSNTKLRNKIIFDNFFSNPPKNNGTLKHYPPDLDYDRLWGLSPEALLIEVRVLSNHKFESTFHIDMVAIDNNQRPKCLPLVAFNPVYPVAAIGEYHSLVVVAYAGRVRSNRGQLIYSAPFNTVGQNVWFSWNPLGTCLLTCVQYTEPGDAMLLQLYKFNSALGTLKQLKTPDLELLGCGSMLTSSLWVSDDSFVWSKGPESPLLHITVTKRNEVLVKTLLESTDTLMTLPVTGINLDAQARDDTDLWSVELYLDTPKIPLAIFGNLFALAHSRSPYYYCVTHCPSHISAHQCIAVIHRQTFVLYCLINIPGHVIEIQTVQNTVFVLFTKLTCLAETDKKQARFRSSLTRCEYDVPEDIDWWKKTTQLVSFTDLNLEPKKLTEDCEVCSLTKVWHKNRCHKQRLIFRLTCDSNVLNATKDFVNIINVGDAPFMNMDKKVVHERVYTNHHMVEHTQECHDHHEQPTTYFYHPTKPFMYTNRHSLYNDFDRPFFSVTPAARLQDLEGVQLYDESESPYNTPICAKVTRLPAEPNC